MNRTTLFHVYANLLAVGKIREMVEYGNVSYILEKYDKYKYYIDKDITSVGDLLSYAYSEMKKYYRNEYVYKNTIITDLIKKHRFSTSVIFNEFRVGRSIADLVFLPKRSSPLPAMVIELKWDRGVNGAIQQIQDKRYPKILENYGGEVILVGISYDKKTKKHVCEIIESSGT